MSDNTDCQAEIAILELRLERLEHQLETVHRELAAFVGRQPPGSDGRYSLNERPEQFEGVGLA